MTTFGDHRKAAQEGHKGKLERYASGGSTVPTSGQVFQSLQNANAGAGLPANFGASGTFGNIQVLGAPVDPYTGTSDQIAAELGTSTKPPTVSPTPTPSVTPPPVSSIDNSPTYFTSEKRGGRVRKDKYK